MMYEHPLMHSLYIKALAYTALGVGGDEETTKK